MEISFYFIVLIVWWPTLSCSQRKMGCGSWLLPEIRYVFIQNAWTQWLTHRDIWIFQRWYCPLLKIIWKVIGTSVC